MPRTRTRWCTSPPGGRSTSRSSACGARRVRERVLDVVHRKGERRRRRHGLADDALVMDVAGIIGRAIRHEQAVLVADLEVEGARGWSDRASGRRRGTPNPGGWTPSAIAHAAHRHVAVIRPGQDRVDRPPARGEDATREPSRRRRPPRRAAPRGPSVPARPRSAGHGRSSMVAAAASFRRFCPLPASGPGGIAREAARSELRPPGSLASWVALRACHFLRWRIRLRIRRSCAHLATSFASSTTGHAFSSGGSGTRNSDR